MKKVFTKVILFIFLALAFTSCQNFLNGNNFKDELTQQIEIAESKSVNLIITVNNQFGTLTGATSGSYKVTDLLEHKLSFVESDDYQFIEWKIYDKQNKESANGEVISIDNVKNNSMTFKVLKEGNDYTISPLCQKRPSILEVSPKYQSNGVPRDRSIAISFDREMDTSNFTYSDEELVALGVYNKNDDGTYTLAAGCTVKKNPDDTIFGYIKDDECVIKNISITSENETENLAKYFQYCILNGSNLKIIPHYNIEDRILLNEGSFKDIKVSVLNACQGELKMRYAKSWEYRVNTTTDDKASIIITCDAAGNISPAGGQFSLGEEIDISFNLNSDYRFETINPENQLVNWEVNSDSVLLTNARYDETTGLYKVRATVISSETAQIKPKCRIISKIKLNISTEHGYITPVGNNLEYKEGSTNVLNYTPVNEYQFICWKMYKIDSVTKEETELENTNDYLRILNPQNPSTNFEVINAPAENIAIKPYCLERPVVLTKSPEYDASGSYRDQKITVLFDSEMDPDSIYFVSSELPSGATGIPAERIAGLGKYYAYTDKNGNKIYKSFEIRNLVTQELLNDCYGEPYFESSNKLIVPAIRGKDDNNNYLGLKSSTQVLVTLFNNFYSIKNNEKVGLYKNEKWNYITNTKLDDEIPELYTETGDEFSFSVETKERKITNNADFKKNIKENLNVDSMKKIIVTKGKFYSYLHFKDPGSGPEDAVMHYKKIYDENYDACTTDGDVLVFPITKDKSDPNSAYLTSNLATKDPYEIDVSDFSDGIYEISIGARDSNGNEVLSPTYYVLFDSTAPEMETNELTSNDFALHCKSSERFSRIVIDYNLDPKPDADESKYFDSKESSFCIYKKAKASAKYFKINYYLEDPAGNKSEIITKSITARIDAPYIRKDMYNETINTVPDTVANYYAYTFREHKFYGRNIELGASQYGVLRKYYKLYCDGVYQKDINDSFTIPYGTNGKHTYTITSVIEVDEENNGTLTEYEGTQVCSFDFYETGAEIIFVYVALNNTGKMTLYFGFVFPYDKNNKKDYYLFSRWTKWQNRASGDTPKVYNASTSSNGTGVLDYKDDVYKMELENKMAYYFFDSCNPSTLHWTYDQYTNGDEYAFSFVLSQFIPEINPDGKLALQFSFTEPFGKGLWE